MRKYLVNKLIKYFAAMVWMVNGLFCKIFNLVPRHQEIVGRILDTDHPRLWTLVIGLSETGMAIWIVSDIKARLNVATQVALIGAMNAFEFILVPELLLWGRLNALFAGLFILLLLYNEYYLCNEWTQHA